MRCTNCPNGQTVTGAKNTMLERASTILVVRQVPADVCDACGEAYYSADVTDELRKLLDAAERSGAELSMVDYQTAARRVA